MGFFDKIQDTISSATEQTKAKGQEVQLKRERTQKLAALGEQVYAAYLGGNVLSAELEPALHEIADIDRRIAEAEEAFHAARPQPQAQGAPPAQQYAPPPGAPAPGVQQYAPPPPAAPAPPPPAPGAQQYAPPPPAAPAPPPPPTGENG